MEDEKNGTQGAQDERQEGGSQQREAQEAHDGEAALDTTAYEVQIAERDARITELEAQVAEAADKTGLSNADIG